MRSTKHPAQPTQPPAPHTRLRVDRPHETNTPLNKAEQQQATTKIIKQGRQLRHSIPEALLSVFPVTTKDGAYEIVQGLDINEFSRARIDASVKELEEEREAVRALGLI
ncbi:hypothetical protein [Streptomyces sp. NPDC005303]|uniref:hypothetical protein n=1 Tax=Streptomyces sp. NPDC005303 TaxID=3155713 RepID=UPI0033A7F01A